MKKASILLSVALLALVACSKTNAPPPGTATGAPATAVAPAPAATQAPAASTTTTTTSESSKVATAETSGESKLERAAPLAPAGQLPAGKWVAGTNYRPLVPAQPTDSPPGKVEVVEVFWYACPHCYALDPYLENWRKSKPAWIDFRRVPVTWGEVHRSHARLFYTLEALGKEEALHSEVFAEMQERKNYMFAQGDENESLAAQVKFATAHGVSASDFTNAYNSFTVQTNLQKADDLVHRYKVEGVPLMIINGKYVTDVTMAGGSHDALINIVNDLAASEKSR
ncbi:MAG TPA: thiol:disulfide interchange protein DsbA/DsbL [Steroidobacteraceae bacterium]|nr:thiol:disulfide interchange protein DsbA/DsbL [Steroidobacteraceae bacterium]